MKGISNMAKQDQAKNLPPKPVGLDNFNQLEVKLTDVENQLLMNTERRKAMLINNVATIFAEELQHITAMFAKKKNVTYSDDLFAGVYYDAPKGKVYILQFKSKEEAEASRNPQTK